MKRKWLASFLAICVLLNTFSGTVAMAEGLDTESAITHQHIDSCYRLEENCIHNHSEKCYPVIESIPEEASPSNAQYLEPTECIHICSEENGCIVKVLDCLYTTEEAPEDFTSDPTEESIPETIPEATPSNSAPSLQECICREKCIAEHINSDCPICKDDISSCTMAKAESIVIAVFEELSEKITEQRVTKDTAAENLVLPKELNATDEKGQTILVEKVIWEYKKINNENQNQERYLFTAKLPEGYVLNEGLTMPTITVIVEDAKGTQILFENGIHYIIDSEYDYKIPLFCMNNKLHWPHHTNDMGDVQVPNYTEGYLTRDDFSSSEDYDTCMRRLSKLLYAGYPYNGERLYKIVENEGLYTPTEAEFNEMLIAPPVLQKAFPYLGHHAFTYQDWVGQNEEHLNELADFIRAVKNLYPNGSTENGLTYSDITAMPFYKASLSMLSATNSDNPLSVFSIFYPGAYFVTEEQAYNATQKAVWMLLNSYNIPDNDINNLNDTELGQILYTYSEKGGLLSYEPSLNDIKLSGSLKFRYNPKDGLWHSGVLQIIEPSEYHGIYHLELPQGVTALCDNLSYVYGNEPYELVSDHEPTAEETFGIRAEFIWLKEFKQYSPNPDIKVNGKKFQHMIGAVIHDKTLSANVPVGVNKVGSLSITKSVIGEENCKEEFGFELRLPYHTSINGIYGDLEFHNGVAHFSLKDKETKMATNLPDGAMYEVTEYVTEQYEVDQIIKTGEIVKDVTSAVKFTNTRLPDLSIAKVVTGAAGNKMDKFNFTIELNDQMGNPINDQYVYVGSVYPGQENQASKPEDGILEFTDGKAQIQLSHGQQITIKNLPYQSRYTVTEVEQHGYTVIYNKGVKPENDLLNTDKLVFVENYKAVTPLPPTGNFSISKIVSGSDGDIQKEFPFTLELSNKDINGLYGEMTFKNGVASFTLKHGESKIASGLPAGTTYTATESDNVGYTVTSTGNIGIIQANQTAQAQFTNHRDKQEGGICVSKTVSGSGSSTSKNFIFTVELSNKEINGVYGEMTFKNGVASFTLKHGESKIASGLPAETTYTVTESDNAGYMVTSTGDIGTIKAGKTVQVQFENYKDSSSSGGSSGGGEHHYYTQITVKKVWKLDNGGKPTDYITAVLMRNGKEYQTVELNAENGWECSWRNLNDRYDWSVKEINVPDGFIVTTEQNGTVVTITNDDVPTPPVDSDKPTTPTVPDKPTNPTDSPNPDKADKSSNPAQSEAPNTSDNPEKAHLPQTGQLWWPVIALLSAGIILVLLGILGKKRYHDKHSA